MLRFFQAGLAFDFVDESRLARRGVMERVRQCLRADAGNIALSTALALPALMAAVGIASDYAQFTSKRSELQTAADQAALAATKEMSLATSNASTVEAAARSFAKAETSALISMSVNIDKKAAAVTVAIREDWTPFFAHFLGADITPVLAQATAEMMGQANICVLALHKTESDALSLDNKGKLTANGCGVYVNSRDSEAIAVKNMSVIKADITCSAGGISNKGMITPAAMTDCPAVEDPLSSRAAPAVGACNFTKPSYSSGTVTLTAGVYCGGLVVKGSAKVTFAEGTYILKGGPLTLGGNAIVSGTHVGFYFTGSGAKLDAQGSAVINLSGPKDGDMAGLLFVSDPASTEDHRISSSNVQSLTGTLYFPNGKLRVDPGAKVAGNSAYTAIVAKEIEIDQGPELILNSDYGATDVPAPEGIRSTAQVVLTD